MDRKALLPELRAKVKASCTTSEKESGALVPGNTQGGVALVPSNTQGGVALVPGNTQGGVAPLAQLSDATVQQRVLCLQPLTLHGALTPSPTTPSSTTPSPMTPSTPPSYFEDVHAQQRSTLSEAQVGEG